MNVTDEQAPVTHQLAELNIGRLRAPLDSPRLADFVEALDIVNGLADAFPGFVWRLQTDDGNATDARVLDDDMVIVNLSVWDSPEALREFVYRSDHRSYLLRRAEWFERLAEAHVVLWWVPAGHRPSVEEAVDRLERLREHGPSPDAFTFASLSPAPGAADKAGT